MIKRFLNIIIIINIICIYIYIIYIYITECIYYAINHKTCQLHRLLHIIKTYIYIYI